MVNSPDKIETLHRIMNALQVALEGAHTRLISGLLVMRWKIKLKVNYFIFDLYNK